MRGSYKGRGVVLSTIKYGDSACIVHLLTDVAGRQSYMVPGCRSSKGRGSKVALLQPLFALEFEGSYPQHGELHRFREMRSGIVLSQTPFDVRRSSVALFCAEVLYRLVRDGEGESSPELFDFVWGSIEMLDRIDGGGVANFHLWFLAQLSRHLGFQPEGEWRDGWSLEVAEGRYVESGSRDAMPVAESSLFSRLVSIGVGDLSDIKLGRRERVAMLEWLIKYYGYHHGSTYSIKSIEVLSELF